MGSQTACHIDGNQLDELWTRLGLDLDWIWIIQHQSNQQSYTRTILFPRDTGVLTLNFVQTLCDCADELNGWPIMLLLGKGIMREVELLNTLIPSDQNQKRESLIQLIKGVYLIHTGKFYLTNVTKKLFYVIIINL